MAMDVDAAHKPEMTAAKLTPLKGLGMLLAVVVVIAGFLVLAHQLQIKEFYAGFFFVLCWSALEHNKLEGLPKVLAGSLFGLALGFAMHQLGESGALIFLGIILAVIYCQLMGWLPLIVNFSAMIFLTVLTVPHIQKYGDFQDIAKALALGILYFGTILGAVGWFTSRNKS